MPYWLRGGIIISLVIVAIIAYDFFAFCEGGGHCGEWCGYYLIYLSLPFFLLNSLVLFPINFLNINYECLWIIATSFVVIIEYFLVGSLIGAVISKFKNRYSIGSGVYENEKHSLMRRIFSWIAWLSIVGLIMGYLLSSSVFLGIFPLFWPSLLSIFLISMALQYILQ